jgi:uncharacterized protein
MTDWPELISAQSFHGRRGTIRNRFTYSLDYVLLDLKSTQTPTLLSRNRLNLFSVHDRHHGGLRGAGQGESWARAVFQSRGFDDLAEYSILLLTQPSFLGYNFNPVSFWLLLQGEALHGVIAEVNNTFGQRHSYFCAAPDRAAIGPKDAIAAQKIFHVSPFQAVSGGYAFNFDLSPKAIAFRITLTDGPQGVVATLTGQRRAASNRRLIWSAVRRPFGAARVLGLIYWQAMKLRWKGAVYVRPPIPPTKEVS